MKSKMLIFCLISLFIFTNCEDETDCCAFVESQEASELIQTCSTSSYTDSLQIANNLLGNWKLIGFGCGFCAEPVTKPTAEITLESKSGKLIYKRDTENNPQDTILHFEWHLEKIEQNGQVSYHLQATPDHYALGLTNFCEQYMFFDHRPYDGQMMLYQKE